jgi:hypothetical protein
MAVTEYRIFSGVLFLVFLCPACKRDSRTHQNAPGRVLVGWMGKFTQARGEPTCRFLLHRSRGSDNETLWPVRANQTCQRLRCVGRSSGQGSSLASRLRHCGNRSLRVQRHLIETGYSRPSRLSPRSTARCISKNSRLRKSFGRSWNWRTRLRQPSTRCFTHTVRMPMPIALFLSVIVKLVPGFEIYSKSQ